MNLNNIAFKIIKHSSPEFKKAVKLREEILRKPLGLTFLPEELEAEKIDNYYKQMINDLLNKVDASTFKDNDCLCDPRSSRSDDAG